MMKPTLVLSLALLFVACGQQAASSVASRGHHTSVSADQIDEASKIAGNYTEVVAERQEANQAAPFTGTMSFVLEAGTNKGTFKNVDEQGVTTTGNWSVESNGALKVDGVPYGYEWTKDGKLSIDGGHAESFTVFARN